MNTSYLRMAASFCLSLVLALSSAFGANTARAASPGPIEPETVTLTLVPGDSVTLTKTVHTPEIPPRPDVIFLADTTGSMGPAIANVQAKATDIMTIVRNTQPDSQFGAANYKDFNCPIDLFAYNLDQAITTSIPAAQTGINAWFTVPGSGCLTPEAQLNALFQLATDAATGWRPDSTHIIAWFGDSSGNDPSNGHTLSDVINALNGIQKIRVIAVPVDTAPDGNGLDFTGQASAITAATGGVLMPTTTTSNEVADAILAGLMNLPTTVSWSLGTCDPNLTVNLTPASQTVTSGTDATFSESITVSAGAPQGTTLDCSVNFLIDGMVVEGFTQSIHITVPTITCTILDDFNRPNGPLGSNWDGRTNGYRIINNEVAVRAGGPIYWQPDVYGPDQEACVTLTRINPKSKQHGLLLKVQELNDWRQGAILVSYNAQTGNVDVQARDVTNHQWKLVGSLTPSTPVVDGDQLRAQALANGTVEVFINDISIDTADAGSFYVDKGGQIGLWFRGAQEGDDDHEDKDANDDQDRIVERSEDNNDQQIVQSSEQEGDGDKDDDDDDSSAARRAILDDFGGGTIIVAPSLSCLDLQALAPFPQTFAGPTFALAPLDFTNPMDAAGVPMSIELTDRPEDLDGKPELWVGFSSNVGGFQPLFAEFPSTSFPSGVSNVSVEFRHFAGATVLALDNTGAVISTAAQPTQNVRASLSLPGSGIRRLQFNVVETLVYRICWIP